MVKSIVSNTNRFASADTLVPDPMNPQQFNRYSYVLNSPLNFRDPTGHICENVGGNTICSADHDDPRSGILPPQPLPIEDPIKGFYDSGYEYDPDPERERQGYHNGVDLGSDITNDVVALAAGYVRVADNCTICRGGGRRAEANFGVGNVVIIEYPYLSIPADIRDSIELAEGDSVYVQYQHLDTINEGITAGQTVNAGDLVGQYGNTGLSDGAHLHLEIHIGSAGKLGSGNKDGTYDTHSNAWHELSLVDPNLIWTIPPSPH